MRVELHEEQHLGGDSVGRAPDAPVLGVDADLEVDEARGERGRHAVDHAAVALAVVRELVSGNPTLVAAAEPILRARADLRRELAGLEKLVRRLAREDRVCRLVMTMPGVGHVIALTFTSAIDDPARFRRSNDVGPRVGLTPGRNQSGDAGLRTALHQAATVMLNNAGPNWLKAWVLIGA